MQQDILHVRDAVSKTFVITPSLITVASDLHRDEFVVDEKHRATLQRMIEFAYNRADERMEAASGVWLDISGDVYDEEIGSPAQAILVEVLS